MRPGDAARWVRPWAFAVELRVEGLGLACGLAPNIPSLRNNICREFGIDVDHARIGTPRPPEAGRLSCGRRLVPRGTRSGGVIDAAGHLAVENDEAGGLIGRSAGLRGQ